MNNVSKRFLSLLFAAMMVFSAVYAAPELSNVLVAEAASAKAVDLSKAKVKVVSAVAYNGKEQTPAVKVTVGKTTLKEGKDYTVRYSSNKAIGKAKITITAKKLTGYTGTKTVTFKILPAKVKGVNAVSSGKKVTVSWNAVKGADGYVVYSYNTKTKKYKKLATVQKRTASVKTLSGKFRFAVKAYKKVGKTTYYSAAYSSGAKAVAAPSRVSSLAVSYPSKNSVKLTWKKAKKADGYSVYYYNRELKEYVLVANTKKTAYTLKNLDNGTYSFCVRAYLLSGSKKIFAENSPLKKATLKNAGFKANEVNRIFESGNYQMKFAFISEEYGDIGEGVYAIKKNGDSAIQMRAENIVMRLVYDKSKDKTYAVAYGMTFLLSKDMLGADMFTGMYFSRAEFESITSSLERLDGKLLLVNNLREKDGDIYKYYFDGNKFVAVDDDLDEAGVDIRIYELTEKVDEKLFEYSRIAIPISDFSGIFN